LAGTCNFANCRFAHGKHELRNIAPRHRQPPQRSRVGCEILSPDQFLPPGLDQTAQYPQDSLIDIDHQTVAAPLLPPGLDQATTPVKISQLDANAEPFLPVGLQPAIAPGLSAFAPEFYPAAPSTEPLAIMEPMKVVSSLAADETEGVMAALPREKYGGCTQWDQWDCDTVEGESSSEEWSRASSPDPRRTHSGIRSRASSPLPRRAQNATAYKSHLETSSGSCFDAPPMKVDLAMPRLPGITAVA
jgi:hypothetical protein